MLSQPALGAIVVQPKKKISGPPGPLRRPGQSEIRQLDSVAWVSLSQGRWCEIDAADIALVAGRSWSVANGYAVFGGRQAKRLRMHRLILGLLDGEIGDHQDGNRLNNHRANLRKCTVKENAQNQAKARSNRTGLKGVFLDSGGKKWQASIKIDGKKRYLGTFPTPEMAHAAYAVAARKCFGEFARID